MAVTLASDRAAQAGAGGCSSLRAGPGSAPRGCAPLDVLDVVAAVLGSVWLLPLLGLMIAVDAPLPVLPSETLLMVAASAAVSRGATDALVALFVLATCGSLLGDMFNYALGRASQRVPAADLSAGGTVGRIREGMRRRPGVVIVAARFLPGGRLVTTVAAGRLGIPFGRFLPWTLLSSALWALYMMVLGLGIGWLTLGRPLLGVLVGVLVSISLAVLFEVGRRIWQRFSAAPSMAEQEREAATILAG